MNYFKAIETEKEETLWLVDKYISTANNKCESLFAQCNGRMGIRGTQELPCLNKKVGFYLAGFYHQATPDEPDELVNFPDLTQFQVAIDGIQLNLEDSSRLTEYKRTFNLSSGELRTSYLFSINQKLKIRLEFTKFVSFADKTLFCQKLKLQVLGPRASVNIQTGIDGQVSNEGVSHLDNFKIRVIQEIMTLQATCARKPLMIQSSVSLLGKGPDILRRRDYILSRRRIKCSLDLQVDSGGVIELEKISRITLPDKKSTPERILFKWTKEFKDDIFTGYDELLVESIRYLNGMKKITKINIDGISLVEKTAIDYAQLQLIGMIPDRTAAYSVGAKGLTGEGYRGHVFWDTEIFLNPFFQNLSPEIARNLLQFRVNGIDRAKQKAARFGYLGALFPWEVTTDGKEKTPRFAQMNIHTGKANLVWSGLKEHHISADIAYSIKKYFESTRDFKFIYENAFEVIIETAKFWVSRSVWNESQKRLEILDVIGPDEYTEHIDNNAYTNYMANENIKFAMDLIRGLSAFPEYKIKWNQKYDMHKLEDLFQDFTNKIYLPAPDSRGIIPQDDSFLNKPVIADLYKYLDNPYKQSILLDYSREEVVNLQVLKQADVVMLQTLLPQKFSHNVKRANLDYYEPKTLHDSSLSPCIHAIAFTDINDKSKAYSYFTKSLNIDVNDNFYDSIDGLHAAAMGGIWLTLIRGFAGIYTSPNSLNIKPCLPDHWMSMHFYYRYLGNLLDIKISTHVIQVTNIEPSLVEAHHSFWINSFDEKFRFTNCLEINY